MKNIQRYSFIICFTLSLVFLQSLCVGLAFAQNNTPAHDNTTKLSTPKQAEETIGELWTGSIYSSTFRAGACIHPDGKVNGVLLLKLKNGQVDTYHFYGNMDEHGIIRAKHNSGYKFKGKIDSVVKVSGEVTLNNGFTIDIEGNRLQNSKLTKTCGPLAE